MLYIPKTDDYLKILTNEDVKDFVVINFAVYFKFVREKQNLIKVSKSLFIFQTTPDAAEKYVQSNFYDNGIHRYNIEILNICDPELQLINTKPMIKTI